MITYFSNDVDRLIACKNECLPKWAMDERLFNCEGTWKTRKGLFIKYVAAFLNIF